MVQRPTRDRFLSRDEVEAIGFARVGRDVQIDRDAVFLAPERIEIGDRSRIDLGVVLSAGPEGIVIEENVHIGARSMLFGGGGKITLRAFCGLSSLVVCYTATDDYTGDSLCGPTVPDQFRHVQTGPVFIDHFVLVGSGALLLPGTLLRAGAVVCAQTVVSREVEAGTILVGRPARVIGRRDVSRLHALCRDYLASIGELSLADRLETRA